MTNITMYVIAVLFGFCLTVFFEIGIISTPLLFLGIVIPFCIGLQAIQIIIDKKKEK